MPMDDTYGFTAEEIPSRGSRERMKETTENIEGLRKRLETLEADYDDLVKKLVKLESEVRDAWAEQIHTSPQIFNLLKSHQR